MLEGDKNFRKGGQMGGLGSLEIMCEWLKKKSMEWNETWPNLKVI